MKGKLLPAFFAAGLTLLLGASVLGVQLQSQGIETVVVVHGPLTWLGLFAAAAVVFAYQLVKDRVQRVRQNARQGSRFRLPAFLENHAQRRLMIALAIGALLLFPFMAERSAVDIATLTLIYVMLGLGLILHLSPMRYLRAVEDAARGAAGILVQFPLYAGVMGMMAASGLLAMFAGLANKAIEFPLLVRADEEHVPAPARAAVAGGAGGTDPA